MTYQLLKEPREGGGLLLPPKNTVALSLQPFLVPGKS